jgi:hypothetical protein
MSVQTLPPCPPANGAPQSLAPAPSAHRLDFDAPGERRSLLPLAAMAAFSWLIILAIGLAIAGAMR